MASSNILRIRGICLEGPCTPRRPFKNVGEAKFYIGRFREKRSDEWPCPFCNTHGAHYHPDDNDPIEGYKLARRRVKCTDCGGSGDVGKKRFMDWYRGQLTDFFQKFEEWKATKASALAAINKLSEDELRALQSWRMI